MNNMWEGLVTIVFILVLAAVWVVPNWVKVTTAEKIMTACVQSDRPIEDCNKL